MGGGSVFRGMARLVGAATVGAAAVPTTGAFCHVHPPVSASMREQESFSATLNHSQKVSCDLNINLNEFAPSVDVRFEHEEDECSLAEKEEGPPTLRRLVFSPPPTVEEVEEATKELHAALHLDVTELLKVLGETTAGLDEIQSKLMVFLEKVNEGEFQTKNGLSYLESKHLLLMFYCQCIVFYILLKANGRSVENHPVIARLIEIRLFLEKIRPIDKKLHYQIEKLLKLANGISGGAADEDPAPVPDDLLYKPNPDMLVAKIEEGSLGKDAIYRPPMIAPTAMEEERILKNRKSESRAERDALRKASRSTLLKDLANDLEGRPEEIKEFVGPESKEMTRELSRLQARAQAEENIFARVPLSRVEKKRLKHLKQSRNGLLGMLDDFDDDISYLVDKEENKHGGTSSQKLDAPVSQADARLRKPKKTTNFKRQKVASSGKAFGARKDFNRAKPRKRDT